MSARNREIHLKKSINFWAPASANKILFDATQSIYNALNFQPDGFFVNTLSLIGDDESPPETTEVLLNNITDNGQSDMVPDQVINFRDSGGQGGDYSINQNYEYTFHNKSGGGFNINVIDFSFEQAFTRQYDRLGILESQDGITYTNVTVSWLQTSADPVCPWNSSFGGSAWDSLGSYNGYIFPSNTDRAKSSPLNWRGENIVIDKPYIKFCFYSDTSTVAPGWDLKIIASKAKTIPVLTCNFTNANNTEEILGVLTKDTTSHPMSIFDYAQNVPTNQLAFELREISAQGVTIPTTLNNFSWFCVLEFFRYCEDPS